MFGNGQTQTASVGRKRSTSITNPLLKFVEDGFETVVGDSRPGVSNGHFDFSGNGPRGNFNLSGVWSKLNRIAQEIA